MCVPSAYLHARNSSKLVDNQFDADDPDLPDLPDLPDVWLRHIDLNVTYISTKWNIWQCVSYPSISC